MRRGVVASVVLAAGIAGAAQLSVWAGAGLAMALLVAFGFAALVCWFRYGMAKGPSTAARYGPIVLPLAALLFYVYSIAVRVPALSASGWKHDIGYFCVSCIVATALTVSTVRDLRRRFGYAPPPAVPAFTQRRLQQFAAAADLPTMAERQRAIRPLMTRGYVRLGLLVAEVVLMLVLAPYVGILSAFLGSLALVMCTFLILHWRFDL